MTNKKGRRWAIVTLDDKSARMDARFFPDMYEKFEEVLQPDKILLLTGQVSFDEYSGGNTISARDAMDIVQAREKNVKWLSLQVQSDWCNQASIAKLQAILQNYQGGSCPVNMHVVHPDAEVTLAFGAQWYVTPEDELIYELQQVLPNEDVSLQFH